MGPPTQSLARKAVLDSVEILGTSTSRSSLVLLVGIHFEDTTAFGKSERIVLVLRVTAQFADEAATLRLAASWALVLVILVRLGDALAVHEQRRIARRRRVRRVRAALPEAGYGCFLLWAARGLECQLVTRRRTA